MNNEKMLILKMLEEKKISAEEASKLLDSLNGTAQTKDTIKKTFDSNRDTNTNNNSNNTYKNKETIGFDDFTAEMSKKIKIFATDLEPKLIKFTETVVEKTANMADKISKNLESHTQDSYKKSDDYSTNKNSVQSQKTFELKVMSDFNQLNLTALNGNILLKGYNGDKISAKVYFKTKKSGSNIDLLKLGNKYYLEYNEDNFSSVSIDAFIPESLFNNIVIETSKGEINISSIKTENILVKNSTGKTELNNIVSTNIKVECDNIDLKINNIIGNNAYIENFNGDIALLALDVQKCNVSTFNGTVNLNIGEFKNFDNYVWEVESSNGKLNANLPMSREIGYYINASTSLSNVKVGLIGLDYLQNNPSFIEAKSINYDSCKKQVMLKLQTSNAPLVIN